MNVTSTEQARGGVQVVQPILQANPEFRATYNLASNFVRDAQSGPRHVGYGLPCSKCGTYYMADLSDMSGLQVRRTHFADHDPCSDGPECSISA